MIAKSDFDYKIRLEELPSIELRDWMYNDVVVTFWESRPKFEKFKEEGAEVESEKVVMDETTEKPVIEMVNHGVSFLFCFILVFIYRSPKLI
tara:strand:- start:800 stop:1075 length:276 start_codon:yes stop_codon:yes gene_type:complete